MIAQVVEPTSELEQVVEPASKLEQVVEPASKLDQVIEPTSKLDRGSVSVELALWAAPVAVVLALLLGAGRVVMADGQVEQAAADAARAASIARTAGDAQSDAQDTATDSLAAAGPACVGGGTVAVDVSEFSTPPGVSAHVSVTVTCTVTFDDLGIPLLAGTRTLSATAVSPLDVYRER